MDPSPLALLFIWIILLVLLRIALRLRFNELKESEVGNNSPPADLAGRQVALPHLLFDQTLRQTECIRRLADGEGDSRRSQLDHLQRLLSRRSPRWCRMVSLASPAHQGRRGR